MATRRYAEDTEVPVAKTKAEIEALLKRYGADQFGAGWSAEVEVITCRMYGRHLRFTVPKPRAEDFAYVPGHPYRRRTEAGQRAAMEQAERTAWRRLKLLLHAKLEAVADETTPVTFEQEFTAYTLLPDGSTAGDHYAAQIEEVYRTGQMPRGLPGLPPGRDVRLLGEGPW